MKKEQIEYEIVDKLLTSIRENPAEWHINEHYISGIVNIDINWKKGKWFFSQNTPEITIRSYMSCNAYYNIEPFIFRLKDLKLRLLNSIEKLHCIKVCEKFNITQDIYDNDDALLNVFLKLFEDDPNERVERCSSMQTGRKRFIRLLHNGVYIDTENRCIGLSPIKPMTRQFNNISQRKFKKIINEAIAKNKEQREQQVAQNVYDKVVNAEREWPLSRITPPIPGRPIGWSIPQGINHGLGQVGGKVPIPGKPIGWPGPQGIHTICRTPGAGITVPPSPVPKKIPPNAAINVLPTK